METELQFLRRIAKMKPEDFNEAIKERVKLLRGEKDVIYFEDYEANEAFKAYLNWRKSEMRLKVTPTIIKKRLNDLDRFSPSDIVEILNYNMGQGFSGLYIPNNIKPTYNDTDQLASDYEKAGRLFQ